MYLTSLNKVAQSVCTHRYTIKQICSVNLTVEIYVFLKIKCFHNGLGNSYSHLCLQASDFADQMTYFFSLNKEHIAFKCPIKQNIILLQW